MRNLAYILLLSLLAACSGQPLLSAPVGDTVAPVLEVTYGSAPSSAVTSDTTLNLTVQGTASDNVGVSKVTYQINDRAEKTVSTTPSTGPKVSFKFTLPLPKGSTKLTVNAYDTANKSQFSFTFTWGSGQPDTAAPKVNIASPSNNATVSAASVTVKGTASDDVGVTRVSYKLNGAAEKDLTITPGTSPSYSFTVNLASGTNSIQVNAYDAAGNKGTATLNLTYSSASNPPPPSPSPPPSSGSWWKPDPGAPISWHWQLSQGFSVPRDLKAGVKVYDFDKDMMSTADTVQRLKAAVAGAIAICYIDVGVYEDYRPDRGAFLAAQNQYRIDTGDPNAKLWGNQDVGWKGSYWLDVRQSKYLLPLMEARIKDCKDKGFDAVEPDESEVWDNNPGFAISLEQNHAYTRAIAELVHRYGLSVGLKGNNGEAAVLEPYHDWALSEQCFEQGECQNLVDSFVKKGKAVFVIEYSADPDCSFANRNHLNAAKRDLQLVGPTASGYLYQPCKPDGSASW